MTCKQTDIGPVTIQTSAKMDDTVTMLKLSIHDSNAKVIRECVNNFDYRNCSCTCALYCDSTYNWFKCYTRLLVTTKAHSIISIEIFFYQEINCAITPCEISLEPVLEIFNNRSWGFILCRLLCFCFCLHHLFLCFASAFCCRVNL